MAGKKIDPGLTRERVSAQQKRQQREVAEEYLRSRKTAYCDVFGVSSTAVDMVLEDLGRFCRENASCFHADPRIHAALEGRREVMLRIKDHLTLTVDELMEKYGGTSNG